MKEGGIILEVVATAVWTISTTEGDDRRVYLIDIPRRAGLAGAGDLTLAEA